MDNDEFVRHVNYSPMNEIKRLYHGSKSGIQGRIVPNYRLARRAIDFGQGFYLGDNPTQAKTLICGRDDYRPILYKADIDLSGLKCVRVSGLPWALLVAYNRGLLDDYRDTALYVQIAGIGDGQDIIAGPIADDRTSLVLEEFFDGTITDAALIACMGELKLGTQYVAKTQRACDRVRITDTFPLESNEIRALRTKGIQRRREGIELVDPVKKRFRRTGDYFDDIIEQWKGDEGLAPGHPAAPPLQDTGRSF